MATIVPDRGDNPNRRVKYSDMSVSKAPSGAYVISHMQNGVMNSKQYMGYTKKQAMKMHKDTHEGR
jgi:hypothetical protein